MSNENSFENYKTAVDSTFEVLLKDGTIPLTLVEAKENTKNAREGYEVFSLLFKSEKLEKGPLPQMTIPLRHEKLGELYIFITPVQASEDGFLYEAIFNREKKG